MTIGMYRGQPFTPAAEALAMKIGKVAAKAKGTPEDKFVALVACLKALGVPVEMQMSQDFPPSAPGKEGEE